MAHNFKDFPELTNEQMELYYFESPHKQITSDFFAEVDKVHDGDTVTLKTDFRDFTFPLRLLNINAPELNEEGGKESQKWMEERLLNKNVMVIINPKNRVDKYGRLLGKIISNGMNINEEILIAGMAKKFEDRNEGKLTNLEMELNIEKWLK
jgi:endonuclease YncB( thermonuclease family)